MSEIYLVGNRYRLLAPVAEEPAAVLYRGQDLETGRTVIVRLLRQELCTDPGFASRFLTEMEAVCALMEHPHLVATYAAGIEGAQPYVVSELAQGRSLRTPLAAGVPLPMDRAMEIAQQLVEAVSAVHRARLVHGDVRPGNVLIAPDGRVRLAGPGLARAFSPSSLSGWQAILGTVRYLAPEQVEGERVETASDVYAIGLVLYEMLSGRSPFDVTSELKAARQRLWERPLSLCQANPDLPARLGQIVDVALEREASARFRHAGQLSRVLGEFRAEGQPGWQPPVEPELPEGEIIVGEEDVYVGALILAMVALIAVLGLVSFWSEVYRRWNPPRIPPATIAPVSRGWSSELFES